MHLAFACPHCRHTLRADAQHAGRRTKCLQCGEPVQIPQAEPILQPLSEPDTFALDPLVDELPAVASPRPKPPQPQPKPKLKSKRKAQPAGLSQRELALFGGLAGAGVLGLIVVVWVIVRATSSTAAPGAPVSGLGSLLSLSAPSGPPVAGSAAAVAADKVFAEALSSAEPGEGPYLQAAQPMLAALTRRDYAALYGFLSSHARSEAQADQFVPDTRPVPRAINLDEKIEKIAPLSAEAFAAWMAKMEAALGSPRAVANVYVQSIDPQVLAGKGDRFDVMLSIGAMRAEIPAAIRKASIRTSIQCQLPPAILAEIAAEQGTSVQQLEKEFEEGERPYFNLKFVLVEEEGTLKIGYFEFMPPSILD
jgi:hypothetical protein